MSDMTGSTAPVQAPAPTAPSPAEPTKRSHGWIWAVGIAGGILLLAVACCGFSVAMLDGSDGLGGSASGPLGGDAIAVINIDSEIAGGGSGVITPEAVIKSLDRAAKDDDVKAVLLRINSPGGTAAASQEIAMEVARFDKPVVASISDVGASGAYMIASQCDEIVASPSADVGSIGVILQTVDASRAMDKLGLRFTVITSGKYKDAGSPFRALTPEEVALLRADMGLVYEQFIDLVAEGRDMPKDKVRSLATGWAWPGVKAKELGLIDTIGNYSDAVRVAAKRGKIEGEPRIETYEPEPFERFLDELSSVRRQLEAVGSAGVPMDARPSMR